jgi:hypothetical protein
VVALLVCWPLAVAALFSRKAQLDLLISMHRALLAHLLSSSSQLTQGAKRNGATKNGANTQKINKAGSSDSFFDVLGPVPGQGLLNVGGSFPRALGCLGGYMRE